VAAAIAGGLIAGVFTVWGQGRQAKADRASQNLQFTEDRKIAARAESIQTARDLFESFVKLDNAVRFAKQVRSESEWLLDLWPTIWTESTRTTIVTQSRLLVEDRANARESINQIVQYLLRADIIANEAGWNHANTNIPLRTIAQNLADEGISIMSAYIRDEEHSTTQGVFLGQLDQGWSDYLQWEQAEIVRLSRLAEEMDPVQPRYYEGPEVTS
jgi:hypothetical protein